MSWNIHNGGLMNTMSPMDTIYTMDVQWTQWTYNKIRKNISKSNGHWTQWIEITSLIISSVLTSQFTNPLPSCVGLGIMKTGLSCKPGLLRYNVLREFYRYRYDVYRYRNDVTNVFVPMTRSFAFTSR